MINKLCFALGLLIATSLANASPANKKSDSALVVASAAGAALDSHLIQGGGADDTAALQRILDRAADGRPIHLIIDGPALVSGLNVHSNTTIECVRGAGLYLKDGAARVLIRNAHRSRDAIHDHHITIRGCFLNGNRDGQPFRMISLGGIDVPGMTVPV